MFANPLELIEGYLLLQTLMQRRGWQVPRRDGRSCVTGICSHLGVSW